MKRIALSAVVLTFALAGCGEAKEDAPAAQAPATSAAASAAPSAAAAKYPKSDAGAKQLIEALAPGDDPKLTASLEPTTEDYKAIFVGETAAKAEQFYKAKLWTGNPVKAGANAGQTETKVYKATTDDIAAWTKEVEAEFPGGYKTLGKHLKPGLTVYRWRYTEPGKDSGMAYEGLIHVNGHWVWVPKAYDVLKG